jgi:MFS family permease
LHSARPRANFSNKLLKSIVEREINTKAYISDLERQRRATAIGIYNFIIGLIYLFASVIAGYLWKINPNYAFIFAAVISLIAIIFFISKRSN